MMLCTSDRLMTRLSSLVKGIELKGPPLDIELFEVIVQDRQV